METYSSLHEGMYSLDLTTLEKYNLELISQIIH